MPFRIFQQIYSPPASVWKSRQCNIIGLFLVTELWWTRRATGTCVAQGCGVYLLTACAFLVALRLGLYITELFPCASSTETCLMSPNDDTGVVQIFWARLQGFQQRCVREVLLDVDVIESSTTSRRKLRRKKAFLPKNSGSPFPGKQLEKGPRCRGRHPTGKLAISL